MRENIRLSIISTQYVDNETEGPVELLTDGVIYKTDDKLTIEYSDSVTPGIDEIRTLIEMENNRVTMSRKGALKSDMIFEKGRTYEGRYETPFGAMSLRVFPTLVDMDIAEDKGSIDLAYELEIQQMRSFNTVNVKYENIDLKGDLKC